MQTLEHITQTQLASGLLRLTPDKGFTLFDRKSHRTFPTPDPNEETPAGGGDDPNAGND